ncbi:MAG: hemolysin family protein [Desulfobacterales bacterium]|jgi:CBS domain containing-hemolysin-like protein
MTPWQYDLLMIFAAGLLVLINGFFVGAEFALVKIRKSRIDEMVNERRPFASTAGWLVERLDASLSACQLGITMASLGLGWIGEPAVAHLIRPLILSIGIRSEIVIHGVAFAIAFTAITAFHLVLGEQAPKIAALRRPEPAVLLSAMPLKIFYYLTYPFMAALNSSTAFLLRKAGIEGASEHEIPHSEEEIRALLMQAHIAGELSRSEHRLINAVFEFDELICRRVMLPRADVVFLDVKYSLSEAIDVFQQTKHTRYPVCDGSLDKIVGVVHIKDLIGLSADADFDLNSVIRPPQYVPETMPVRRLLRQFQSTHQHLAFLVDEYGTVSGIVTLENILESIIGPVEDEFDEEQPEIVSEGPKQYNISGNTSIDAINQRFGLRLEAHGVDTITGLMMARTDKLLAPGERVELSGATAEVLEVKGPQAIRIRLTLSEVPPDQPR